VEVFLLTSSIAPLIDGNPAFRQHPGGHTIGFFVR